MSEKQAIEVGDSTNDSVKRLKELFKSGFMVMQSNGNNGDQFIKISFSDLRSAQEAHRCLINILYKE